MPDILHYHIDPKLWELWSIPYYGYCRISIINHISIKTIGVVFLASESGRLGSRETSDYPEPEKCKSTANSNVENATSQKP